MSSIKNMAHLRLKK